MKKIMILLAAMAMSTLAIRANEPTQPVEITIASSDTPVAVQGDVDQNETSKEDLEAK